ncbi:MAG: hypothetical protein KatS3mg102_2752 [Planctomycetota bacterium]|nr:MAG: hypothetical protein KatS3mg102_2752 [Planctomycetota bacterium]
MPREGEAEPAERLVPAAGGASGGGEPETPREPAALPEEQTIEAALDFGEMPTLVRPPARRRRQTAEVPAPTPVAGAGQSGQDGAAGELGRERANETAPSAGTLGAPAPCAPSPLAAPPARLAGYELLGELGRGGMGVVYRARQQSLEREVALKVLRAGRDAEARDLERFRREALAAARLRHPAIVPIYEIGEERGHLYIAMELVEGQPLSRLLREGALQPRRALEIVATIADGLETAHRQGIVHRDVKPGNILIDAEGRPRLTDFGLAKDIRSDSGLTETGQTLGTPGYMSPEQAAGLANRVDPRTDVYALGAVLYELLVGVPPFRGENVLDTLRRVTEEEPVPPRQLVPALHRDVETICLKCLRKEPQARYPSAAELAADIRRYLAGEMIHARRPGLLERFWRRVQRQRAVAAVLLVALLSVVAVAGYFVYREHQRNRSLREAAVHQLRLGRQAYFEQRYSDAIAALERARALVPGLPEVGEWLQYAERRRAEERAQAEQAAAAQALREEERRRRWQRRAEHDARLAEAEAHLAVAAHAEPAARYAWGKRAYAAFEQALQAWPDSALARAGRGRAALLLVEAAIAMARRDRGGIGLAREWIDQAALVGVAPELLAPLARRLEGLTDQYVRFEEALEAARRLAESEPAQALGAIGRAYELARQDEDRERVVLLEKWVRRNGVEQALQRAAASIAPEDRLAAYREALAFDPGHERVRALYERERARALAPPGFRFVPGGPARLGSEDPRDANPLREAEVAPFYMAVHEVTNHAYQAFVDDGGYQRFGLRHLRDASGEPGPLTWSGGHYPPGTENHPVTGISFREAEAYARWFTERLRERHPWAEARLPSAEEWEYAAGWEPETGRRRLYPWGERYDPRLANVPPPPSAGGGEVQARGGAPLAGGGAGAGGEGPRPRHRTVAVDGPPDDLSPSGLRHMGGNAHEWTVFEGRPCLKGGSFDLPAQRYARTSWQRPEVDPEFRTEATGMRLALSVPPPSAPAAGAPAAGTGGTASARD